MKKTKKAFKSSICGGYKGKVVIQKTNLSLKKALASNVVAARAARVALKGETVHNHLRGSVLANDSELIGVLKGIKQVLKERGVQYSTAPGESGCQQAKVRQKANDERRRLLILQSYSPS